MESRIWADAIHPALRSCCEPWERFGRITGSGRSSRQVLLYQAYVGARDLVGFLADRDEPLVVYYHNITPATFVWPYDHPAAALMEQGREDVERLVPRIRVALAASEFSARELRDWGVNDVRIVVPSARPGRLAEPDAKRLHWLRESKRGIDLLFVGRVAPHKGHQHLLRVLAALRAGMQHDVRLFAVGSEGPEAYMLALTGLADRLGVEDSAVFTGPVTEAELAAHYEAADVFLCLSEHEGFCIPLLEAMRAGLPVVAYAAGAVSETLNGSGILLGAMDPYVVAEVVSRVVSDETLRRQVCARQRERAAELDRFDWNGVLVDAVHEAAKS
jgi:L-malate glycosyltransferase